MEKILRVNFFKILVDFIYLLTTRTQYSKVGRTLKALRRLYNMATISEIATKLKNEVYRVLDGQFYMNDGTKVTYNPCKDPKYSGCFYCSIFDKNGNKQPTIIIDPNTGKQVG